MLSTQTSVASSAYGLTNPLRPTTIDTLCV
jgi:hypothetical protein